MQVGLRIWIRVGLAVSMLAVVGCGRRAELLDRREERDPLVQRALVRKRANDIDGAIKLFEKALERKPRMARPHLELGVLYDSKKEDYIRAIYHYQRYLELRPDSEKRDLIRESIRFANIFYAASLPDPPLGALETVKALKRENKILKNRLDELSGRKPDPVHLAQARPAPAVRPPPQRRSPPATTGRDGRRTYVVQGGDTLSSIARTVYSDAGKWERIFDANRDKLPSPQSIKVGQTLVIP